MKGPSRAIQSFRREVDETQLKDRCDRALKLWNEQRAQDARKYIAKTIARYPSSMRARHLGWDLALPDDHRDALGSNQPEAELRYREIVKAHPDNPSALLGLASIICSGDKDNAASEASVLGQQAVALAPEDPGVLTRAALICRFEDLTITRDYVGRARNGVRGICDPGFFQWIYGPALQKLEGMFLFADGLKLEGLAMLETSHEREPENADTAQVLAAHLSMVGECRRALDVIDRTLPLKETARLTALRSDIAMRLNDDGAQ